MRSELGISGKAIWDAFDVGRLDAGQQALVLEYARCADTADRLDALVRGRREAWASLVFDDMGEVHLQVDKVLDQARSNQVVLRGLHAEIRQAGIKAKPAEKSKADEEPKDMLTIRRLEREKRERQLG